MKTHRINRLIGYLFLAALLLACLFLIYSCGNSKAESEIQGRADVITIDAMKVFDMLSRSPVEFPHDKHTEHMKKIGLDCSACHLKLDNGYLSTKFLRIEDDDYDRVMNIYHDSCISCHKEQKLGPQICGDCHLESPIYYSTAKPVVMDKSLHYLHIKGDEDKCELCHHRYDSIQKKLVYVKGQESSCRDCHKDSDIENAVSYKQVSHWSCIKCHQSKEKDIPTTCAGCHSEKAQAEFEVVENPPRLQRNQPDFVLLSAGEDEITQSKLNSVPFSHVGHEGFNQTCRVCHHKTMKACKECHTLAGSEMSDGITLQQAMHEMDSDHSCVGCHETHKSDMECAGCHNLMEQNILSDHACKICHAGPAPERLAEVRSKYNSLDDFRLSPEEMKLSFADRDIPDTVTINVLENEYHPSVFPHRKIVMNLLEGIANNRIASHFHGHEDVVCQGCHHNSPIGQRPPLCESCHGEPFNEAEPHKPGLMGAYHQQCIGCHSAMNISEPSDCAACHKKK